MDLPNAEAHVTAPVVEAPSRWRAVLSVGVGLALLAWVVGQLNLAEFWRALSRINHLAYLAFMFLFVLLLLAADSAAIASVYVRHVCAVQFREVFVLRGASYLPAMVNYHIGQAWLTWFAAKVYGAKLGRVAGATLLNYATMFGSLAILAACAYPLAASRIPWLGSILLLLGLAAVGYALIIIVKPRVFARMPGASVLLDAGILGHLKALAWRFPHMVILFLGMWLPFRFFHVSIPLGDALAYVPILMLIGALPITPQGVGTRDVIALKLLAGYAPAGAAGETVAAATLCWAVALTLMQVLIAPVFLYFSRELFARAARERAIRSATTEASIG